MFIPGSDCKIKIWTENHNKNYQLNLVTDTELRATYSPVILPNPFSHKLEAHELLNIYIYCSYYLQ